MFGKGWVKGMGKKEGPGTGVPRPFDYNTELMFYV